MATQKKIDTVSELSEKITRAKSIVLADYRGLKHKQLEQLRKNLKKSQGEFVVAKNRLMRRALRQGFGGELSRTAQGEPSGNTAQQVETYLTDATAALFSYADEVGPLKELVKFFKTAGMGKTKGGLLGNQPLTDAEVARLSLLPSKNELLGQLVGQLNAPIQGLHHALNWNIRKLVYAINAIKKKK